jgi:excinuclease ABC subunit A
VLDQDTELVRFFSRNLMCPTTGISYQNPEPNLFSFNSPKGACDHCNGLGTINEINTKKIIPNPKLSIKAGGFAPLGEYKSSWIFKQLEIIGEKYSFKLTDAIDSISEEAMEMILNGGKEKFIVESKTLGVTKEYKIEFEGISHFIKNQHDESGSTTIKRWAKEFMDEVKCPVCEGSRLKKESLYFKINEQNIADLSGMDISDLTNWFNDLENHLSDKQKRIATEVIKEIKDRLNFLMNVGLDYLSLSRSSKSLSGGEAQRIRLATQIGSQLVGVLYILDEPSIGLHQRDNEKLIHSLEQLRDIGNSVIVVEHDKDMIERADYVIDIGPKAGKYGGEIISKGTPAEILATHTMTAMYLNGEMKIEVPKKRRDGNGKFLKLTGATGNNLKNVSIELPLGQLICVTGV